MHLSNGPHQLLLNMVTPMMYSGNLVCRKTMQTWENVSEIQIDDGFQWRKYGQKAILNGKYSR